MKTIKLTKKKYMLLRKVKIKTEFLFTKPKSEKLYNNIFRYLTTGYYKPIVLDADGYLIDGYCTYLLFKLMKKKIVPVEVSYKR